LNCDWQLNSADVGFWFFAIIAFYSIGVDIGFGFCHHRFLQHRLLDIGWFSCRDNFLLSADIGFCFLVF